MWVGSSTDWRGLDVSPGLIQHSIESLSEPRSRQPALLTTARGMEALHRPYNRDILKRDRMGPTANNWEASGCNPRSPGAI